MGIFKPNVGKLEMKKDVQGLIKALKHKDVDVRTRSAKALGKIGEAVDPLFGALKDENVYIRKGAVQALGEVGDTRVLDPLIHALSDEDEGVRQDITDALNKIGEPAIKPLSQALKEGDGNRMRVAEVLDKLGWKPRNETEKVYYLIAKRKSFELVALGETAVEPLIQSLQDKDHTVREFAANALGRIGNERALEPLMEALQDKHLTCFVEAGKALALIGNPHATKVAIEALTHMLKLKDPIIMSLIVYTLTSIGEPAVEPLIEILQDTNKHIMSRTGAAMALGGIGDVRAAEPLFQALKDQDEDLGVAATKALEALNRFKEAEEHYKRAMRLNFDLAEAHYNLGNLFQSSNRDEQAEKAYRKAINLDPNYASARYRLGNLLVKSNKLAEAGSEYIEAIRIRADFSQAHKNLGYLYETLGNHSEAEKEFREAIRIDPQDEESYFGLGRVTARLHEYSESEQAFRQAITLQPRYAEAYAGLAITLRALARRKEAKNATEAALELYRSHKNVEMIQKMEVLLKMV